MYFINGHKGMKFGQQLISLFGGGPLTIDDFYMEAIHQTPVRFPCIEVTKDDGKSGSAVHSLPVECVIFLYLGNQSQQ